MCQAKPGPRCSSHTKAALDKALQHARDVLVNGGENVTEAMDRMARASLDYAGTPAGRDHYLAAMENITDPDNRREVAALLLSASEQRNFRAAAAKAAQGGPIAYADALEREAELRGEVALLVRKEAASDDQRQSMNLGLMGEQLDAATRATRRVAAEHNQPLPNPAAEQPTRCTMCGRWRAQDVHECPEPSLSTLPDCRRLGEAHALAGEPYDVPLRLVEVVADTGQSASIELYREGYQSINQQPVDDVHSVEGQSTEQVQDPLEQFGQLPGAGAIYSDIDKDHRLDAIKADLRKSIAHIVESGQLGSFLDGMSRSKLGSWSFQNRLLALMQLSAVRAELPDDDPNKTANPMLMSAAAWKREYGAYPKKGSKAIWIMSPVTIKVEDEDAQGNTTETRRMVGVRPQAEFDISQMQGDKLPVGQLGSGPMVGEAPPGARRGLIDRITKAGYRFQAKEISGADPASGRGTLGYTDPKTMEIVVDSRCSPAQYVGVLAHEIGHVKNGHVADVAEYRKHRGRMETEAEATAYMVSRALGVKADVADSFSASYIAGWSKGDPDTIEKALTQATKAFNEIMAGEWPDSDD